MRRAAITLGLFILVARSLLTAGGWESGAGLEPNVAEANGLQVPNRFFGTVKLAFGPFRFPVPAGTEVQGLIGGKVCGSATTQRTVDGVVYVMDVAAEVQTPGCGTDGDTVRFRVKLFGLFRLAEQTGTFATGNVTRLDLTVRLRR